MQNLNSSSKQPSSTHFELQINASGATNQGLKRQLNEDALLSQYPVFIIADGMGGHESGELASKAVVESFAPLVNRDDLRVDEVLALSEGIHGAIVSATQSENSGSTLAGAIVVVDQGIQQWLILNLGDSRVYRFTGNHLFQITKDHSLVQEMVDQGKISREEAFTFSGKNVITRAYGDGESVVDSFLFPIRSGERLLVCSDGLTGELIDREIFRILAEYDNPEQASLELVNEALSKGGRDNISVIVIDANLIEVTVNEEVYKH